MPGMVFTPPPAHRADVIDRLNKSVEKAIQSEPFKKLEKVEGLTIAPATPEDFDSYVQSEANRWRDLIKAENIQVQ